MKYNSIVNLSIRIYYNTFSPGLSSTNSIIFYTLCFIACMFVVKFDQISLYCISPQIMGKILRMQPGVIPADGVPICGKSLDTSGHLCYNKITAFIKESAE